ncbi:MAG: EamA family transporter RarD [bacterium]|nr:EamA family transporter RarD [bacterium]
MNRGIALGIGAYLVWGILPIFWKTLATVDPLEILAHRVVWSVVFLVAMVAIRHSQNRICGLSGRAIGLLLVAGSLLAVNWLTYIWAVNNGHIVESSLGYFINPLFNVVLGVLVLRERLEPVQWVAVGVAALGVGYMTVSLGTLPWIALVLASTFAAYALLKKQMTDVGPIESLTVEVALISIPALVFLTFVGIGSEGSFGAAGPQISILLVLTGVATAVPLALFGAAARRIRLSTIGLLQYIAPTMQFLLGVFIYDEVVTRDELIGFVLVWAGLAIYSAHSLMRHRRIQPQPLVA